jgi:signal transduction histidine kinase
MDQSHSSDNLKTSVDLTHKLEHLLLGFEVLAFEKNIALNYQVIPEVKVICNSEQISQVLIILLDNAVKYTPSNGSIEVKMVYSTHYAIIEVINTGTGISENDVLKIFDRFYRVDTSRSRQDNSYGLGLSIAKSIVDQHGGKLVCDSVVDEYTRFTLKLKK